MPTPPGYDTHSWPIRYKNAQHDKGHVWHAKGYLIASSTVEHWRFFSSSMKEKKTMLVGKVCEERIKSIQIGKEELKCFLFEDDILFYTENSTYYQELL